MMTAAAELETAGFWVGAVRPPTVPEGTARLRISLTSEHRPEEIEGVVNTLQCKPFIHKKPTYIPTLI
jgi:8-amino-7-oxononanoate synthase